MKLVLTLDSPASSPESLIEDGLENLDPLMRHKFCILMNKDDNREDRIKLAQTCKVNAENMKKEKNETEYILNNYKVCFVTEV